MEKQYHQGFVAGTPIHTDRGLVPIEQLKVGDLVLSMPESGSTEDKAYKRVVKTFKSPTKQKIMSPIDGIYCTDNHPFWVKKGAVRSNSTWVSADQLNLSDSLYQLVEPALGYLEGPRYYERKRDPYGIGGLYLIATDQESIAIFLNKNDGNYLGDGACIVDFRAGYPQQVFTNERESYLGLHCYNSDIPTDGLAYKLLDKDKDQAEIQFYSDLLYRYILPDWADEDLDSNEGSAPFYDYVYNIEVQDYHTYFVGPKGIWVHQ